MCEKKKGPPSHKHRGRRKALGFAGRCDYIARASRPAPIQAAIVWALLAGATLGLTLSSVNTQQVPHQQSFLVPNHGMENFRLKENTPVDSVVYQLKAVAGNRRFSYHLSGDYFKVNESSGEVRLVKALDREKQSYIVTVVNVFDMDDRSDSAVETKRRIIQIEDVDDSWPSFAWHKSSIISSGSPHQSVYHADVKETLPLNSTVISDIRVSDADEGQNAEIVLECRAKQSTNYACDVFAVEQRRLSSGNYSVSLRTKAPLDYERIQSYKISLVARGKRPSVLKGVPLETEAIINVDLINVQDEGPAFLNAPYILTLHEGLKSGTPLLNVLVQDGDSAPQRELTVIVVPGPYKDYFHISKDPELDKVWYLESNKTIDRESPLISGSNNMFTISLLAAELDELGNPIASEEEMFAALKEPVYTKGTFRKENVTVVVLDLPDSRPSFVRASSGQPIADKLLTFSISEALLTGSALPSLDLAVLDYDQGVNSRFNLSIVDASMPGEAGASRAFGLDSELIYGRAEVVMNVLNSSLLDYEVPEFRLYKFHLVASKKWDRTLDQTLEIHIHVLDANDNAPEFELDQYVVEVAEGIPAGSAIASIQATDRDSGSFGMLGYALRGQGASKFTVDSSGMIHVADCGPSSPQCLDYELQASYSLIYEARDGGGKSRNVSLVINILDINDHAPQFTEPIYKRELISDNLSSKQSYISPQLIVKATDADGTSRQGRNNVTYRIKSSNLTNLDVDPESGLVYLAQPLDLDALISSYAVSGKISQLDRKIVFEAEVVAEDNGEPMKVSSATIQLVIKGNPDGAPRFRQDLYQALVLESHPVNKPFFQVQALDPDEKDSQLRYSLGYDLNDLISVNALTGELSLKTKVDYDSFKGSSYNISVYATDNSRPYPLKAMAVVSIHVQDVNNKRPEFEEKEYKATLIQERSKPGDRVLQVTARDLDKNARLNYSIVPNQLTVHDRNGQQFTLQELLNSTTGYLSQMSRFDREQLVDSLRNLFRINETSGSIELQAHPDYSFAAAISILVRVLDSNQEVLAPGSDVQQDVVTCTFFLQTHINKSPIFAPPWTVERRTYNISMLEELAPGTAIFSLLAKDPSTNNRIKLFEKSVDSDPKDFFRVDRSGIVYLNKRVDYEQLVADASSAEKRLNLLVKAIGPDSSEAGESQAAHYSWANLSIEVVDLNDNAPQFKSSAYSVAVSEALVYPQQIVQVEAEDRDSRRFNVVHYSIAGYSSDLFSIDPLRGIVTPRRGARLDRDADSKSHLLLVSASDCNETSLSQQPELHMQESALNCRKSSVFVNISLLDENDNDPSFVTVNKRGELEAVVSETASAGSILAQLVAVDLDDGPNGTVVYQIVAPHEPEASQVSRLLSIDKEGFVSLNGSLAGLGRSQPYRVLVKAADLGKPDPRYSLATLVLTVNDVVINDGVPRFVEPQANEIVSISEATGAGVFVYKLRAEDPDATEVSGRLMYKFVQPSDTFDIDPFTGVIKTQNRPNFMLDRETLENYTLIVMAHDLGSPPKQAHKVLTIKLTDVNDNEPFFERAQDDPPVVLYVREEVPRDHVVGVIQALDRDEGLNAMIGYEILEGNSDNLFRLESEPSDLGRNPCKILVNGRLDMEQKATHTLTIRATSISKLRNPFVLQLKDPLGGRNPFNQYNASDLSKIRVTIKLLDINDNRPTFLDQNAKAVIDSSTEIYSQLMVFRAQDADSSNQEVQYSLLDALFYSDSRLQYNEIPNRYSSLKNPLPQQLQASSVRHVFEIDPKSGILRNAVSLKPYADGYFVVLVKADSSPPGQLPLADEMLPEQTKAACNDARRHQESVLQKSGSNSSASLQPYFELENCFVAVAKATIFVTHHRETFRFVFNKTKLNDRFDEFKVKVQEALEELIFEGSSERSPAAQASTALDVQSGALPAAAGSLVGQRPEKVYLNTFNTDFYERPDGSLDFSTLTSCSQLVRFDDRAAAGAVDTRQRQWSATQHVGAPNTVVGYQEVLSLFRALNVSSSQLARQQKGSAQSLLSQYGLIAVERCENADKNLKRMSLSQRVAIYLALSIGFVASLLILVVARMRKSYEKNLKLLQRSKYQYMNQYATMPPPVGLLGPATGASRPALHHISLTGLHSGESYASPPYSGSMDVYDSAAGYESWQM